MTIEQLVLVAGSAIGIVGAITTYINTRGDAASKLTGSALEMVEKMERDIQRLDTQVKQLREEVELLEDANEKQAVQMNAMRKTIARLEELVEVYRKAFSELYDQLLSHDIRPAVERPE